MVTMDLETILVVLVVFLLSALLIYLIWAFTMRETTFEQVMEEQKRNLEVQPSKPKEQKKDKKKKYKKGKPNDKGFDSEVEKKEGGKEEKMVELEPDPEYIEVSDSGSASTPPKKSKPVKTKPILTNKEEKVLLVKETTELFHRKNVPKDAVELKHEREQKILLRSGKEEPIESIKSAVETKRVNDVPGPVQPQPVGQPDLTKASAAQQTKKDGSKKKKPVHDVVEEEAAVVEKVVAVNLTSSTPALLNGCEPTVKAVKKNKQPEFADPEIMTNDGGGLLASIQMASLSDAEIRSLIDILIGKYSDPNVAKGMANIDWTKKGQKNDPAIQLRRQLEERDRAFAEEQQRSLAAASKIKEMNQELLNERQKFASLAKMNQDQKVEIQALQARMQESHVQHLSEINHSISQIQNLKGENKILQDTISKSQHLAGAEKALDEQRQKVAILESALQQLSIQLNGAENAKKASEGKAKQFEERIHEMEKSLRESQSFGQQYKDLSEKLHKSEARLNSLNLELMRSEEEKNAYVADLKSKEAQLNELNCRLKVNSAQLENIHKESQQKEIELQDLKAELHEARTARRELTTQQQSPDKVEVAETNNQAFQVNDQLIAEKDEAMKQIRSQLEEKLKELQAANDELVCVKNSYSKLESEKNDLLKSFDEKSEKSFEQNAEVEELRKAVTNLEAVSLSQSQELSRLVIELQQKESSLEKVKHESSSKSQEMSRLVNELLQKDVEVEKTNKEIEALRTDNAVLSECRQQCEELKTSLVTLSEQLLEKEAKQIENEAHLTQMREKEARWIENAANLDAVNDLRAKIDEKELELRKLNEERSSVESRLKLEDAERQRLENQVVEYDLQLKELRMREEEWLAKEDAGLADSDAQRRQMEEAVAKLESELSEEREKAAVVSEMAAELLQLKCNAAKHEEIEAELKRALETSESTLAARDLQLQHLQEANARVAENELQLMELREKSSRLQKLEEKFGNFDELEVRLMQLAEKDEKLAESEKNGAEAEAKLRQIEEELARTRLQLEEMQRHLNSESTANTSSNNVAVASDVTETSSNDEGKSPDLSKHREVTVFTHVQEKASWDMSKLVLDLDTKQAEIQILQSVLTQKESTVHELEEEKTRLMEMIENMQMELWAKEKQIEARSSSKQDDVTEELNEAKQARSVLQAEVLHYQTILADTERILKQIESNVDTEEQKWREKYEATLEENVRLQDELTRLKENSETHSVTD